LDLGLVKVDVLRVDVLRCGSQITRTAGAVWSDDKQMVTAVIDPTVSVELS
jgi:hypothetical protein